MPKHKIKGFLNKLNRDSLYDMGKASLEREAQSNKLELSSLNDEFVKKIFFEKTWSI